MKEINSYSSPFNLGHKALTRLWDGEVVVQEKVDDSQFSFGVRMDGEIEGVFCRSRRMMIDPVSPGMFAPAVETVLDLFKEDKLKPGWTYRGEFLAKPKSNTLTYERVPAGHIVLFDIDMGDQDFLAWEDVSAQAHELGLEPVRTFAVIRAQPSLDDLKEWLTWDSALGGCKIEGIALKNYDQYGPDKKVLIGKLVSDDFREKHSRGWPKRNPSQKMYVETLIEHYTTEARWTKAVQHLREEGKIEGVPQDIPIIMREIVADVEDECGHEIAKALYDHFWPKVRRGLTRGAAEWYKSLLAEEAFAGPNADKGKDSDDGGA